MFNSSFNKFHSFTTLLVVILIQGCTADNIDDISPTLSVTSNADGVVSLGWLPPTENVDGTALTDLTGYKIYYDTSPTSLKKSITVSDSGITSYVIEGLQSNKEYYFAITALNSAAMESVYSNIVNKYF